MHINAIHWVQIRECQMQGIGILKLHIEDRGTLNVAAHKLPIKCFPLDDIVFSCRVNIFITFFILEISEIEYTLCFIRLLQIIL